MLSTDSCPLVGAPAGRVHFSPFAGVWWDWDPRLTTTAVMVFAFGAILALRRAVHDPSRRATWSAVAAVLAFVDVPIVYFSVRWWNSLHQQQSTPQTVASAFHLPLRLNAFGILFLMIGFLMLRSRLATYRLHAELADVIPTEVEGSGGAGGDWNAPPDHPDPSTTLGMTRRTP